MKSFSVCVIGLGYIGLPTTALLASAGHQVVGVDVNPSVVETINQGKIHIVEPDLEGYVAKAVASGNLRAQVTASEAEVFMICVPTPFHHGTEIPTPNMDYVVSATKAIAPYVKPGNMIVLESTSPVGSTEMVRDTLNGLGVKTDDLYFAYCPERVLPGSIMRELVENDRIVGGLTPEGAAKVAEFYRTFVTKGEVLVTDARTAEMAKLTENSFRDVNIAFANELSLICHKNGINVQELIDLANRHPRVNILRPGAGVGGHCIAVDPWFIVSMDPKQSRVIRTSREVNDHKAEWTCERIKEAADQFERQNSRPAKIAALGLAFKPNIDDLRESPALEITGKLIAAGYQVLPVEPNIHEHENLKIVPLSQALAEADVVAILVSHREFESLNLEGKVWLDFCGVRGYKTQQA